MLPSIVIPSTTINQEKAEQLRATMKDAAALLDDKGAWPTTCGEIQIRILNNGDPQKGDDEETTQVLQMMTLNQSVDSGPFLRKSIQRKPGTVANILVSVDLFESGIAHQLLMSGASQMEIAVHFLAHEIRHLTEIERLSSGQFTTKHRASRFASAFCNELQPTWKSAIKKLIKSYPDSTDKKNVTQDIRTSEDIADEACADLIGLYWFDKVLPNWKTFSRLLGNCRKHGQYTIEEVLIANTTSDIPIAPIQIHKACWLAAFHRALADPALPKNIRGDLATIATVAAEASSTTPSQVKILPKPR
jgi:hypothetical protein